MNTVKKHQARKPQMKPKVTHAGGGAMKISHGPKAKSHPTHAKPVKAKGKRATGMASANFKKNIPVKGAKAHAGGKKGASDQKNPFGHGETIKFGFS